MHILSKYLFFFVFGLALLGWGCNMIESRQLHGRWQAISLTEEGDSLKVNLPEIGFTFGPGEQYHFTGTLKMEERGLYRYRPPYLYSIDTSRIGANEKAVEIIGLIQDTLVMKMMQDGKERLLTLKRIGQ